MPTGKTFALTLLLALLLTAGTAAALSVSVPAIKAAPSSQYGAGPWQPGLNGTGVVIAILDTGVDDDHPALRGAFVAGAKGFSGVVDGAHQECNSDGTPVNPDDSNGHGTHVAGIALSRGSDGVAPGVAPGAGLVDVQIAQDFTGISLGGIRRGIQWVLDYNAGDTCYGDPGANRVDVISISAGTFTPGDPDDATSQMVERATRAGVVVVAAAGNCGPKAKSPDCQRKGDNTIVSPAVAPSAIAVAAADDRATVRRGDDVVAGYSSRGPGGATELPDPKPNVAAPGTGVHSACWEPIPGKTPFDGGCSKDGTSMAAPHVSGVAALMLQANPGLAPADVKRILQESAEDPQGDGWDAAWGHGLVDARAAVAAANRAPAATAAADPLRGTTSTRFHFTATASRDPDGGPLTHEWRLPDGTTLTDRAFHHVFRSAGTYRLTLTTTDVAGATSTDHVTVEVEAPPPPTQDGNGPGGSGGDAGNEPPVARVTATPQRAEPGERVTFDASGSSDADGAVARYEWDLDGDGAFELGGADYAEVSRPFRAPGAYDVSVRVVDDAGATSAPATVTVSVYEAADEGEGSPGDSDEADPEPLELPVILTPDEGAVLLPGEVRVRWSGNQSSYEVHLDDALMAVTTDHASPVWLRAGNHTIRVVGVADDGRTAAATVNVTVTPGQALNRTTTDLGAKGADVGDDAVPAPGAALALAAAALAVAVVERRRRPQA